MSNSASYSKNPGGFHGPPQQSAMLPQNAGFHLENGVAIPSMVNSDVMQNHGSLRRESLATNNNGIISPTNSHGWDVSFGNTGGRMGDMAQVDIPSAITSPSSIAPPPFGDQNVIHRVMQHHPLHQAWAFDENATPCEVSHISHDPTSRASFDATSFVHHRTDSPHTYLPSSEANARNVSSMDPPFISSAISPQSHQDWMGMAQQEMEHRPATKRMRPSSPPITMVDFARRDGIRKKNGRIDIPAERNIHTIDDMIEKTTDEDLLKELKQQKRLLRNREAALASRQRKKKHTEDLEVKEKSYTQQIAILEKEVGDLAVEQQGREEERQILVHRLQESQRIIETLQEQIRELNFQHSEETSTLRKRINILTDHVDLGGPTQMSAASSSAGFADFNAEMEALNMGAHDWDHYLSVNDMGPDYHDFAFQHGPGEDTAPLHKRPAIENNPPSTATKIQAASENSVEQPIASGLLFMLLLCGAFVASKPANSATRDLPDMPPDVRAAAPAVLNSLLGEASGHPGSGAHNSVSLGITGVPLSTQPYQPDNRLDRMHQRLIAPSKQQEIDQAFSLTATQYASISGMDYSPPSDQTLQSKPRRTLAEALAATHSGRQQANKAEVYTRSLLWEQIPAEVVKQFKEMVRDHQEIETRQNEDRGADARFEPKHESR